MFVEYPDYHAHNCWKMFNPLTRAIHTTRDVIWLHWMYYPNLQSLFEMSIPFLDEEGDDDKNFQAGEGENNDESDDDDEPEQARGVDSDDQGLSSIPEETEEEIEEENEEDDKDEDDPTERADV